MPLITKLIPRRNGQWVEVVPDTGPNLKLPLTQLPHWASVDVNATDAQWMELGALARFHGLYDRALRLLARREHFTAELERKLSQREPDRKLVQDVLAHCRERGFIDDERAAASTVQSLLVSGGCGKARLKHELYKRGCPNTLIENALTEHAGELDEEAEIAELLSRRRSSLEGKAKSLRTKLAAKGLNETRLRREVELRLGETVVRFLRGRGFSGDVMYSAARELVREIAGG